MPESNINPSLEDIHREVMSIKEALIGNSFNKHGIVSRLEAVEKHVDTSKRQQWIVVGISLAVSFFVSALKYIKEMMA